MTQRWFFRLILIVMLAAAVVPFGGTLQPAEAGGSWSVWLYNQDTGVLVQAYPDGLGMQTVPFPLPPDTSEYPSSITFSRNGSRLAACLKNNAGQHSVRVYDLTTNLYIAAYIPPGAIEGCGLSSQSFSEDGTQLAFGVMHHYYDPANPTPDWELNVMEMNTSAILYHIDSSLPAIAALGQDVLGSVPFVTAFSPGVIAFKPVRWGTEPSSEYPGIVWQLDGTNYTSLIDVYGKTSLDLLTTNGEAIWVEENPSYPPANLVGMGYPFNVVMYSNKAGDRYGVFSQSPAVLTQAAFIDGGSRIAIKLWNAGVGQWQWLDRTGNTGVLPLADSIWTLAGTPDGYVFYDENAPGGHEVRFHRLAAGMPTPAEDQLLWKGAPGEYWRMVWVMPLFTGAGLLPFQPSTVNWVPGADEPIIPTPEIPGTLTVGGRAQVYTTEGDMLRVRTGPGTGFQVSFQVPNGTIANVLEGPAVDAEGLVWWRIEVPGRGAGWAIEGLMDNGVYLQTLVPVP
ncbi:MAG: SH3 domain-containing protein [Anaerolineae bacterium]|nr:SH3 domain-containing protein [Anaerolineae bacterium]